MSRRINLYDKRDHGIPYECGDLVWLYAPVVLQCQSKKPSLPEPGLFVPSGNSLKQFIRSRMCKHLIDVRSCILVVSSCALQACASPVYSLQPLHLQYLPVSLPSKHLGQPYRLWMMSTQLRLVLPSSSIHLPPPPWYPQWQRSAPDYYHLGSS